MKDELDGDSEKPQASRSLGRLVDSHNKTHLTATPLQDELNQKELALFKVYDTEKKGELSHEQVCQADEYPSYD